ncbi:MAG: hypothetical protein HY520_03675 [Candidatus Aenigmarchaeota archaeon]|nr:hypothetical protein [Candidatus Aenigmarchaeota archaeon]
MRGITPIISIIILLLITVSLAGAAFTFLQGYLFSSISKSFTVPTGGAYCSNSRLTVYVLNTGYQSTLRDTDFSVLVIDGNDVPQYEAANPAPRQQFNKETGQSGKILDYACGSAGPSPACGSGRITECCKEPGGAGTGYRGYHTIDIGTSSGLQHLSVYCS